VRLPGPPGCDGFNEAYTAAQENKPLPSKRGAHGSITWLLDEYRQLAEWQALAPSTRQSREAIFHRLIAATGKDVDPRSITQAVMQRAVDARSPHASRNMLKALRPFFRWLARHGHITANPCDGLELAKARTKGFHTWTVEEVDRFRAHWPEGTRARLAADLLLFTGLRRGDVVRLGRQHIRGDMIELGPSKTERHGITAYIPLTPPLLRAIEHAPKDQLTFLMTEHGKPFQAAGFGNWFGDVCEAAGVPGRAHGLRKAGAVLLAEETGDPYILMAVYGWRTLKQAEVYTREANRRKLAQKANIYPRTLDPVRGNGEK
jgi:integrase